MVELDVSELSSLQPDELAARLGGKRAFDAVVSVDFLSCLAFGAGLDPDEPDDADALGQLDHGLCGVLRPGGHYYDFMAVAPNSQFILRFVPDYCSAHPGRFICVLNDNDDDDGGGDGGGGSSGGGGLLLIIIVVVVVVVIGGGAAAFLVSKKGSRGAAKIEASPHN